MARWTDGERVSQVKSVGEQRWSPQKCSFGEDVQQIGDNDLQRWWTYCKAREESIEALESGDDEQDRW